MSQDGNDGLVARLGRIDRRWIFLAMALAIIAPILMRLRFEEEPQRMAQATFDTIEALPAGSKVLMSLDYDPSSEGELQPMANALIHHCASRGHKIVFMTLWPFGTPLLDKTVKRILLEYHPQLKYGTDYVTLGYKPGLEGVVKLMSSDIPKQFTTDKQGTPIGEVPLLAGVKDLSGFQLVVSVSAGYPGAKEWVQFGNGPTPDAFAVIGGTTAVQAAQLLPYFPKQMEGMLLGIKGAAEYELLVQKAYMPERFPERLEDGRIRMGSQVVAHMLMIALIVLGNIVMAAGRARGGAK